MAHQPLDSCAMPYKLSSAHRQVALAHFLYGLLLSEIKHYVTCSACKPLLAADSGPWGQSSRQGLAFECQSIWSIAASHSGWSNRLSPAYAALILTVAFALIIRKIDLYVDEAFSIALLDVKSCQAFWLVRKSLPKKWCSAHIGHAQLWRNILEVYKMNDGPNLHGSIRMQLSLNALKNSDLKIEAASNTFQPLYTIPG